MPRNILKIAALVPLLAASAAIGNSQSSAELINFFKQQTRLDQQQIDAIQRGEAFAKNLDTRSPDEIFMFGVVYVKGPPEGYVKLASDFNVLRKNPEILAIERFSNPPQLSDLQGFSLDSKDVADLKDCKPTDCNLQLAASGIQELHRTVNWSAPDVEKHVNQLARQRALQLLLSYQRDGNKVLGVYNDKHDPNEVAAQFKYMLSFAKGLPKKLPKFYKYLLDYPNGNPGNVDSTFYWANVKFGLKPTQRLVHVLTLRGSHPQEPAYTIAEKQLYSSHYFETALDLTYLVRGDDPQKPGYYLVKVMGSEQSGLTGLKGSIVRKVAVSKSVSSLQESLAEVKKTLEQTQ